MNDHTSTGVIETLSKTRNANLLRDTTWRLTYRGRSVKYKYEDGDNPVNFDFRGPGGHTSQGFFDADEGKVIVVDLFAEKRCAELEPFKADENRFWQLPQGLRLRPTDLLRRFAHSRPDIAIEALEGVWSSRPFRNFKNIVRREILFEFEVYREEEGILTLIDFFREKGVVVEPWSSQRKAQAKQKHG